MTGAPDGKSHEPCRCEGHSRWTGSKWPARGGHFTPGRRGPSPGYCGACGGKIPSGDAESQRLFDETVKL